MKRLIIGCGYLGRRGAERWTQAGDEVHAMTRSAERGAEFAASGWQPVIGDVTAPETLADLPAVDTLLFAVGMDRSRYTDIRDVYVRGLERSLAALPRFHWHRLTLANKRSTNRSTSQLVRP